MVLLIKSERGQLGSHNHGACVSCLLCRPRRASFFLGIERRLITGSG